MGEFAIRAEHVSKRYRRGLWAHETLRSAMSAGISQMLGREQRETGWFNALDDISFEVKRGESVALIGDNGAGKSTLLKILSRITPPTKGRIELRGRLGSLLEVGAGFHPELTGRDNIYLNGLLLGMTRQEITRHFDEIVDFSGVEKFLGTPVKRYSTGMYMRLAFAVAAHLETEILLVDEVLAVGDYEFQQKCLNRMDSFSASGRTIVFVSHNLNAIRSLCDRSILLQSGRIVDEGATSSMISRYMEMHPGGGGDASITFEAGNLPTSGRLQLLSAQARPRRGQAGDPIHVKSDIELEFTVRVGSSSGGRDPLVSPAISIRNAGGDLLFNVGPPEERSRWAEGVYRLRCHVPRDLLNNGRHVVGFEIRENDEAPLDLPRLLQLEIMDHDADRFGWFGEWPGLIRPRLMWERERMSD